MEKILGITEDEMLSNIAEMIRLERPGEGWYLTREIAERVGISAKLAANRLQTQYEAGNVEKVKVGNRVYWRVSK